MLSENNAVVFKVASGATSPKSRPRGRGLFGSTWCGVNTIVTKARDQALEGQPYKRSDMKKAIVRLAEGQSIDITEGSRVMALKQYKPTSPSRRGLILVDKSSLWKASPVKALTEGKRKTGGRNNKGHVTSRASSPRSQAEVSHDRFQAPDLGRRCNRRAARVRPQTGRPSSHSLPTKAASRLTSSLRSALLQVTRIVAGKKVDVKPGNAMEIGQMPVGTIVHNVEMKPGKGGQIARAGGTYVQVVGRDRGMVIVRLQFRRARYIRSDCMATVGAVSNPDNATRRWPRLAGPAGSDAVR